jgi:hypothetical protein
MPLDLTQRFSEGGVASMLDLAIILTATTLSLLIVTVRSFGRALESRRTAEQYLSRDSQ